MTQSLQRERAKYWGQLRNCLFKGFIWGIVCSVLGVILAIVLSATFVAVLNVTQGMNIQESQYIPVITVLFLIVASIFSLLGFSSSVAAVFEAYFWRRSGRTAIEYSLNATCGHVLAMALTGYMVGITIYYAIHIFLNWLQP